MTYEERLHFHNLNEQVKRVIVRMEELTDGAYRLARRVATLEKKLHDHLQNPTRKEEG